MTTTTLIHTTHLVRCYSFAARLSPGYDTLADKLARIRAEVAGK